jgi:hypothetical protein
MDRMRAARNKPSEQPDTHKAGNEPKWKKQKSKGFKKPPKEAAEITAKDAAGEINNQPARSEGLRENASNQSATQPHSLKVQRAADLPEIGEESGAGAIDQKQREKLDWFSTWDED